jgi:hypothetical protein
MQHNKFIEKCIHISFSILSFNKNAIFAHYKILKSMLKKILSISGKSGLFKLISQGKNMIIVESLIDKKRTPSYSHEKVVSLGDIAIFTEDEEVPLREVFDKIKTKENGSVVSVDPKSDAKLLQTYFAEVLPDFDRERVFPSDIKKVIIWYNLLINNGITDFKEEELETEA